MLSSVLDLSGDLINYLIWVISALLSGDPLYNLGSSFPRP